MRVFKLGSLVALAIFGGAASATVISIPGGQRSSGYSNAEIEGAAKQYARNLAALTRQGRKELNHRTNSQGPLRWLSHLLW
jgi:type II secretory pathway pseudopilin PulG